MTVAEWVGRAARLLEQAGLEEAEANAEWLMASTLGCSRPETRLRSSQRLSEADRVRFWQRTRTRAGRVPLGYILGTQAFLDFELKVTPAVLIPRPETEGLVSAALGRAAGLASPHILEIGTGSGCVSIALARRLPRAMLYATDISRAALAVAEENARALGVASRIRFLREDLFRPEAAASPWADMIVSNPPYVPSAELSRLADEVREEPALALDGGPDGLDAFRALVREAPRRLKPGGWIALEIGAGQGDALRALLAPGFDSFELVPDLQGVERVALARRRA